MRETIAHIRTLLLKLESEAVETDRAVQFRAFSGLELPDIICDFVDLLMPELKPYEVSIYLHLLRRSVIESGTPYVRVSRRGLASGVVKSAYAGSTNGGKNPDRDAMSYKSAQTALSGLEGIGAIRQEGEPNRDGTLFRVLLPEEIDVCKKRRAKQTARQAVSADEREADFYNIRENRVKIYERDGYKCTYCGKQLTRFTATLDHVKAVMEGGDNSAENLVTACLQCNSRKTARPLGDFLAES